MATHSSILVWEIPWTEDLVVCIPWGHKRVRHNFMTKQQQIPLLLKDHGVLQQRCYDSGKNLFHENKAEPGYLVAVK